MTRNQGSTKRSTHNSSIRVPLLMDGPGFRGAQQISELVGLIDVAPTLLEAAGVPVPPGWKVCSLLPLLNDPEARQSWPNQQLIQISGSMTGRAIRTKDWTYCVADPSGSTKEPAAVTYHEYQLYDQRADPNQLVNLAGRQEYRSQADEISKGLKKLLVAAGEPLFLSCRLSFILDCEVQHFFYVGLYCLRKPAVSMPIIAFRAHSYFSNAQER